MFDRFRNLRRGFCALRAEALTATPWEQSQLRVGRERQMQLSCRVGASVGVEAGRACVQNVWKQHVRKRGRWREVDEDEVVWFSHGRLWRVHQCVRRFVRYLRRRASAGVRDLVVAGVTREEAGETLYAEMCRAVDSERRLMAAEGDAERRVCHLAQSVFWRVGGGKRKKRRKGGGVVAPPRVRKERLDAIVEYTGKKRMAEVLRRERELDEGLAAWRRR